MHLYFVLNNTKKLKKLLVGVAKMLMCNIVIKLLGYIELQLWFL